MTLLPQSLAGAVCAVEGVRGAVALLHGSTGCKFHLAALVEQQDPREVARAPLVGSVLQLYGQSRVPCTDIWAEDLVFGGEAKLEQALDTLLGDDSPEAAELVAVIASSPLAAIGDDLQGLIASARGRAARAGVRPIQVVAVDGGGLVGGAAEGFQRATRSLVREVARPDAPRRPETVNLLGLSVMHPRWSDDVAELRRMLRAIGVEVNAVLTAGATLDEIRRLGAADLNVVIHAEYGAGLARELGRLFHQPNVGAEGLAPIGLANSEAWLRAVGEALGLPSGRIAAALDGERSLVLRRMLPALSALDRTAPLKGRSAAIFGEAGPAAALATFLTEYLGIEVVLLGLDSNGAAALAQVRRLEELIGPVPSVKWRTDLTAVRDALAEARPNLVFGGSFERAAAADAGLPACCHVDFGYPLWHRTVLTERPVLGYRGTLALVEDVLNAAAGCSPERVI